MEHPKVMENLGFHDLVRGERKIKCRALFERVQHVGFLFYNCGTLQNNYRRRDLYTIALWFNQLRSRKMTIVAIFLDELGTQNGNKYSKLMTVTLSFIQKSFWHPDIPLHDRITIYEAFFKATPLFPSFVIVNTSEGKLITRNAILDIQMRPSRFGWEDDWARKARNEKSNGAVNRAPNNNSKNPMVKIGRLWDPPESDKSNNRNAIQKKQHQRHSLPPMVVKNTNSQSSVPARNGIKPFVSDNCLDIIKDKDPGKFITIGYASFLDDPPRGHDFSRAHLKFIDVFYADVKDVNMKYYCKKYCFSFNKEKFYDSLPTFMDLKLLEEVDNVMKIFFDMVFQRQVDWSFLKCDSQKTGGMERFWTTLSTLMIIISASNALFLLERLSQQIFIHACEKYKDCPTCLHRVAVADKYGLQDLKNELDMNPYAFRTPDVQNTISTLKFGDYFVY